MTNSTLRRTAAIGACVLGALSTHPTVAAAQSRSATAPAKAPRGWVARADAGGNNAEVRLAEMKPGFHVTTGPATIVFDSTMRASGNWRLEATLLLYNPGARAEGFGVIFGGRGLSSSAPTYAYALVRRDGKALLKVREGTATRTVRDWTANAAIPQWTSTAGASVKYPLVIEARADRVTMSVGGTQVLDAPRSELPTDGIVGLRVNHALNLHVDKVSVRPLTSR